MNIQYKDYFDVLKYYSMVNEIVDGYFDESGDYAPHLGDMAAMLVFFNECVINKKDLVDNDFFTDPLDANELYINEDFINAFNEAITFKGLIKFDFANVFKNAMEIVHYRCTSPTNAINKGISKVGSIVDSINAIMNQDTVDQLLEFAKNVSDGKYDAKAVADVFAESEAFKKIAEMERSE